MSDDSNPYLISLTGEQGNNASVRFLNAINQHSDVEEVLGKGFPFYGGLDKEKLAALTQYKCASARLPPTNLRQLTNAYGDTDQKRNDIAIDMSHKAVEAMRRMQFLATKLMQDPFVATRAELPLASAIELAWSSYGFDVNKNNPTDPNYTGWAMKLQKEIPSGTTRSNAQAFGRIDFMITIGREAGSGHKVAIRDSGSREYVVLVELKYLKPKSYQFNMNIKEVALASDIGQQLATYVLQKSVRQFVNLVTYVPVASMLVYRQPGDSITDMNRVFAFYWTGINIIWERWKVMYLENHRQVHAMTFSDDLSFVTPSDQKWVWNSADPVTGKFRTPEKTREDDQNNFISMSTKRLQRAQEANAEIERMIVSARSVPGRQSSPEIEAAEAAEQEASLVNVQVARENVEGARSGRLDRNAFAEQARRMIAQQEPPEDLRSDDFPEQNEPSVGDVRSSRDSSPAASTGRGRRRNIGADPPRQRVNPPVPPGEKRMQLRLNPAQRVVSEPEMPPPSSKPRAAGKKPTKIPRKTPPQRPTPRHVSEDGGAAGGRSNGGRAASNADSSADDMVEESDAVWAGARDGSDPEEELSDREMGLIRERRKDPARDASSYMDSFAGKSLKIRNDVFHGLDPANLKGTMVAQALLAYDPGAAWFMNQSDVPPPYRLQQLVIPSIYKGVDLNQRWVAINYNGIESSGNPDTWIFGRIIEVEDDDDGFPSVVVSHPGYKAGIAGAGIVSVNFLLDGPDVVHHGGRGMKTKIMPSSNMSYRVTVKNTYNARGPAHFTWNDLEMLIFNSHALFYSDTFQLNAGIRESKRVVAEAKQLLLDKKDENKRFDDMAAQHYEPNESLIVERDAAINDLGERSIALDDCKKLLVEMKAQEETLNNRLVLATSKVEEHEIVNTAQAEKLKSIQEALARAIHEQSIETSKLTRDAATISVLQSNVQDLKAELKALKVEQGQDGVKLGFLVSELHSSMQDLVATTVEINEVRGMKEDCEQTLRDTRMARDVEREASRSTIGKMQSEYQERTNTLEKRFTDFEEKTVTHARELKTESNRVESGLQQQIRDMQATHQREISDLITRTNSTNMADLNDIEQRHRDHVQASNEQSREVARTEQSKTDKKMSGMATELEDRQLVITRLLQNIDILQAENARIGDDHAHETAISTTSRREEQQYLTQLREQHQIEVSGLKQRLEAQKVQIDEGNDTKAGHISQNQALVETMKKLRDQGLDDLFELGKLRDNNGDLKTENQELHESLRQFEGTRAKNVTLTDEVENLKKLAEKRLTALTKTKKAYDDLLQKQQTMFAGDASVFERHIQRDADDAAGASASAANRRHASTEAPRARPPSAGQVGGPSTPVRSDSLHPPVMQRSIEETRRLTASKNSNGIRKGDPW